MITCHGSHIELIWNEMKSLNEDGIYLKSDLNVSLISTIKKSTYVRRRECERKDDRPSLGFGPIDLS